MFQNQQTKNILVFGGAFYPLISFCREIIVNFRHNLVEVRHESKEAVFENLDNPDGDRIVFEVILSEFALSSG